MNNALQDIAGVVSLFLTIPFLLIAWRTIARFGPKALQALKESNKTHGGWIFLGIASGFLGNYFDNLYWAIPWSLNYVESPNAQPWFQAGSIPNVFFRQSLGIFSAYCHLRSLAAVSRETEQNEIDELHAFLWRSAALGGLFVAILLVIKGGWTWIS